MAVVLNLNVVPITKNFFVPQRDFLSLLVLALAKTVAQLATDTTAEDNQTFIVLFEQFMVDAWQDTAVAWLAPRVEEGEPHYAGLLR